MDQHINKVCEIYIKHWAVEKSTAFFILFNIVKFSSYCTRRNDEKCSLMMSVSLRNIQVIYTNFVVFSKINDFKIILTI